MAVKTRKLYEGKNADSKYSTFVFVVNGKGDWGNGEPWDETDWETARDLAVFIRRTLMAEGYEDSRARYITEGDAIWFLNDRKHGIGEWKEIIEDAYRDWKERQRS